jgi:hypothetical protein
MNVGVPYTRLNPWTRRVLDSYRLSIRFVPQSSTTMRTRKRASGRRREPDILDPLLHSREYVGLRVAATYLGLHPRSVVARIDRGELLAAHDGHVWRIPVTDLVRYRRERLRP